MNWKECPATLSAMLMIALTTFMKGISLVYSILILNKEIRNFLPEWERVILHRTRRVPVALSPESALFKRSEPTNVSYVPIHI